VEQTKKQKDEKERKPTSGESDVMGVLVMEQGGGEKEHRKREDTNNLYLERTDKALGPRGKRKAQGSTE